MINKKQTGKVNRNAKGWIANADPSPNREDNEALTPHYSLGVSIPKIWEKNILLYIELLALVLLTLNTAKISTTEDKLTGGSRSLGVNHSLLVSRVVTWR